MKYIYNNETLKIELQFEKAQYEALDDTQKAELKSGFLWSNYGKCWVSRSKFPNLWRAKSIAENLGFTEGESVGNATTFKQQQEIKASKAEARAERYEQYSDNANKRCKNLQKELNSHRGDIAFFTQPIIAGHSGSQRFKRQCERIYNKYDKGFEEMKKAEYFNDRAETAKATAELAKEGKKTYSRPYVLKQVRENKRMLENRQRQIEKSKEILPQVESGATVLKRDGTAWTLIALADYIKKCETESIYIKSTLEYYSNYL